MWKYFLLSMLLFSTFPVGECLADNSHVYISEIMWNGSSTSTADEWIELYNPTDLIVDLKNWQIFDEVKGKKMVDIPEGQIPPKGNLLISNNSKDHMFAGGESVLNIDPDVIDSGVSLSNENLKISLKDSLGETVDVVGNGSKPFFYKTQNPKASISRIDDCVDGTIESCWELSNLRENLDAEAVELATPRNSGIVKIIDFKLKTNLIKNREAELQFLVSLSDIPESINIYAGENMIEINQLYKSIYKYKFEDDPIFTLVVESKTGLSATREFYGKCVQLSNDIFISEAMPDPSTGEEWLEIANGGNEAVNIQGWTLADLSGKRYVLPAIIIEPLSFVVIYSSASKLALNNTDESVILSDPLGAEIDVISWKSSVAGHSIAKWAGKTYRSSTPTPGGENIVTDDGKTILIDRESELDNSLGKKISTQVSNIEIERGYITGEIVNKKVIIKYDKQIELRSGSRYNIESVIESENPLAIRLLSISLVEENEGANLAAEKKLLYTKVTKTKITTKNKISKKKIKGIKSLERPPNSFKNSDDMVKLLVVTVFCYCGVIYAIYSKQ